MRSVPPASAGGSNTQRRVSAGIHLLTQVVLTSLHVRRSNLAQNGAQLTHCRLDILTRHVIVSDHADRRSETGSQDTSFSQLGADRVGSSSGLSDIKDRDVRDNPFRIDLYAGKSGYAFGQQLRIGVI